MAAKSGQLCQNVKVEAHRYLVVGMYCVGYINLGAEPVACGLHMRP